MSGNLLSCRGLTKRHGSRTVLLGIDLDLRRGETCALLGESGAGKTTLARLLCGLDQPDGGECHSAPGVARMLVPQDFVIWPHLTVERNVRLGARGDHGDAKRRTQDCLQRLGIAALAERRADQLSFGQQQRVALARALCFEPDLLVLDEPLAHLDTPGRRGLVEDLKHLIADAKLSVVWATHDAREAFAVGAKVAVLDQGRIGQCADPVTVYREPATVAIGQLTGDLNVLSPDQWAGVVPFLSGAAAFDLQPGEAIGFRPEALRCEAHPTAGWTVVNPSFLGSGWLVQASASGLPTLRVLVPEPLAAGTRVRVRLVGEARRLNT